MGEGILQNIWTTIRPTWIWKEPLQRRSVGAFHLTLSGGAEVWYTRLPEGSIRSWPDMKKTFLKCFATSKEGDRPIQRLQDMRQQRGEALKSFLSRFTDEMTYCVQVTDREALTTLRGGLDMNSLFWRDVQNRDPATYDALLEMIRREILNEELKDHRNRASRGLPPPQMQRGRGPTSHLMDHQAPLNHGQELAAATLNAVLTLAYEEVNPALKHNNVGLTKNLH